MPEPLEQPRILQMKTWWNQLDNQWKIIFRKTIGLVHEPTVCHLENLVNLQSLDCSENQISDLKPLHALTNLDKLNYGNNSLSQAEIDQFQKAVPNCQVKKNGRY